VLTKVIAQRVSHKRADLASATQAAAEVRPIG
jgi:hypothetical protein